MAAASTFQVGGKTYSAVPMGVFQQFHVGRRLGGAVVDSLSGIIRYIETAGGVDAVTSAPLSGALPLMGELVAAVGRMSDKDTDFVIETCLGTVSRQDGQTWSRLMPARGQLMYEDVDLRTMLEILWHVVRINYANFFSGLASMLPAAEASNQPTAG